MSRFLTIICCLIPITGFCISPPQDNTPDISARGGAGGMRRPEGFDRPYDRRPAEDRALQDENLYRDNALIEGAAAGTAAGAAGAEDAGEVNNYYTAPQSSNGN